MNTARPLPAPPDDSRVYSLQALRGIAAWTVVFSHIMQIVFDFEYDTVFGLFFSTYSHFGVTVFFIISGFVMYQTAIKQRYSAWEFSRGRLVRIVPAYWTATLVLVGAISLGAVPETIFSSDWSVPNLIKSFLFIPYDHPSIGGEYPVLTVGWSLNYEMFFYAILALCIFLNPSYAIHVTAAVVFVLPLVGIGLGPWTETAGSKALYFFFVGILLSIAWNRDAFDLFSPRILNSVALAVFCIAAYYLLVDLAFAQFVFSTLLVIVFLLLENEFRRRGSVLFRVSQWLGDVSYSTYLYHVIVILFLVQVFGVPDTQVGSVAMVGAVIVLTCLVSEISYRLIEQKLGRRLARRTPPKERLPTAQLR